MNARMNARIMIAASALVAAACGQPASTTAAAPTPAAAPSTAASVTPASSNKTNTWDGVFSATQAQRGAGLYQATCNRCHGPQAANTADDGGRLVGKQFVGSYDGVTLDQLFTTISNT